MLTEDKTFKSEHNLGFLTNQHIVKGYHNFKVGTVHGTIGKVGTYFCIDWLENKEKNNGHLIDTFQWLEHLCKMNNYDLLLLSVENERFRQHLITKKGFLAINHDNVVKKIKR